MDPAQEGRRTHRFPHRVSDTTPPQDAIDDILRAGDATEEDEDAAAGRTPHGYRQDIKTGLSCRRRWGYMGCLGG